MIASSGLRVSSLCRGGFFTTADPAEAQAAETNNRAALEEAAALRAATLVLVPGGLPAGVTAILSPPGTEPPGPSSGWCRTRRSSA